MAGHLSKEQRRLVMSHIHSNDTRPEKALRKNLWRLGFRYVKNDKRLPGKPDLVLPKYRTVVFVHGCFWHAHQGCETFRMPRSNTDYWERKITRNLERDQDVWRQLEAKGWNVIIVWECQLKKVMIQETIANVATEIRQNGEKYQQECENRKASREAYCLERKARKEKESALMAEIKGR